MLPWAGAPWNGLQGRLHRLDWLSASYVGFTLEDQPLHVSVHLRPPNCLSASLLSTDDIRKQNQNHNLCTIFPKSGHYALKMSLWPWYLYMKQVEAREWSQWSQMNYKLFFSDLNDLIPWCSFSRSFFSEQPFLKVWLIAQDCLLKTILEKTI